MAIDELGDLFDMEIDDDDVDTAGGLLAKALGSRNPVNMAYATFEAFRALTPPEDTANTRGADVNELVPWLAKARKEESDNAAH